MGKAMTPVGVIADMACSMVGDNIGAKKFLALQFIALGFQQMHLYLNHDTIIESVPVALDGSNQYELPCSFVYETKVGIRRKETDTRPAGRLCTLSLNTGIERSVSIRNDTQKIGEIREAINMPDSLDDCNCYYYNGPNGTIYGGFGRGYANHSYYNIKEGVINLSPYLYTLGDDLELVIEFKSDGLQQGLELVPAEAYLALLHFCLAMLKNEGDGGPNRNLWESQWKTLKRLYNKRQLDVLVELFSYA